jgi:hypothetical protein
MKNVNAFLNPHVAQRRRCSLRWAAGLLGLLMLASSHASDKSTAGVAPAQAKTHRIWMTVGERRFAVTLADTDAARAFADRLPLALPMTDLNANEKKFDLPNTLPSQPSQPGTIRNGDLMLWGANTVVLFYLSFVSPYAYTRLGRVDDPNGLAQVLGNSSVQVGFSAQN